MIDLFDNKWLGDFKIIATVRGGHRCCILALCWRRWRFSCRRSRLWGCWCSRCSARLRCLFSCTPQLGFISQKWHLPAYQTVVWQRLGVSLAPGPVPQGEGYSWVISSQQYLYHVWDLSYFFSAHWDVGSISHISNFLICSFFLCATVVPSNATPSVRRIDAVVRADHILFGAGRPIFAAFGSWPRCYRRGSSLWRSWLQIIRAPSCLPFGNFQ